MGKTVRPTEPLAFSFQIWPRTQLQKEVSVSISITESTLPVLSCGKHLTEPSAQDFVIGTHTVQHAGYYMGI